jgi:hypothetical protein
MNPDSTDSLTAAALDFSDRGTVSSRIPEATPAVSRYYRFLKPHHIPLLEELVPQVLLMVRGSALPGADAPALDALVEALITFVPALGAAPAEVRPGDVISWVRTKVKYALRTHAKGFRLQRVRAEYLRLLEQEGYPPTLRELSKASQTSTRNLLSVWPQIAADLQIPFNADSILGSILSDWALGGGDTLCTSGRIVPVASLHRLKPKDASLLLMRYALDLREKRILRLIHFFRSRATEAELYPMPPDFGCELRAEYRAILHEGWRKGILSIQTKPQLRARIHRARWQLRKILSVQEGQTEMSE